MVTCEKTPRPDVLIRYVQEAEQLAAGNPQGEVPNVTWLRNNDHAGLYQYMRAHPKPFRHLKREVLPPRTCDEKIKCRQIALAKKLAQCNGGVLPSGTQLGNCGYGDLVSYMRRHPRFFEDIPQTPNKNTPEEHVKTAETLARKNGGSLPGPWTIVQENGWALYQYMRRNRSLFSHIPGALKVEENDSSPQCNAKKSANRSRTIR